MRQSWWRAQRLRGQRRFAARRVVFAYDMRSTRHNIMRRRLALLFGVQLASVRALKKCDTEA